MSRKVITMTNLIPVEPVRPPAAYMGGKSRLAKQIITLINKTPHTGYADVFVGMGGIFFRRDLKPKTEVINDFNGDVANLFRILEHHYGQFMDELKYKLTCREEFQRLIKLDPTALTDLQRAARFLYLQKTSFGGKVSGQSFGLNKDGDGRFNLLTLGPLLDDIYNRMSGVTIENLTWQDFVKRWDRDGMLFYLDPPYWNCENDYGKDMFSKADFTQMAKALKGIRGTFILSINDVPEIRQIFKGFKQEPVSLKYSIAAGNSTEAKELIISG